MYHIVICDDEPIFLTQISEMIIDILKYTSISELKNTLQNTPKSCDILILDIMLGENLSGRYGEDQLLRGCYQHRSGKRRYYEYPE